MWGTLLIRRRIAVEGLQGGRSALKAARERDGLRLGLGLAGWIELDGKGTGSWMDVYDSQDMTEASRRITDV